MGPVARILVSDNRWLRDIKTYRFPWYLTPVSANHASNNPDLLNFAVWLVFARKGKTLNIHLSKSVKEPTFVHEPFSHSCILKVFFQMRVMKKIVAWRRTVRIC